MKPLEYEDVNNIFSAFLPLLFFFEKQTTACKIGK
jgi:hypothetical protein